MKQIITVIIILFSLFFFNVCGYGADGEVLITTRDPAGDDYGPGTYEYPTNEVFKPYKGLFDLTGFSLKRNNTDYIFSFEFAKVTDPWNSKYGFSMPLIEVYIDNEKGGSTDILKGGANIKLDTNHPWNKMLKISGWWVRLFTPGDKENQVDELSFENNNLPEDVVNCRVKDGNIITLNIKKDLLGSLNNSHIYVLIGSFDPFGHDHFRSVKPEKSSWNFSDPGIENAEKATRVIDVLMPEGKDQQEILTAYGDDYCQVYPVKVRNTSGHRRYFQLNYIIYFFSFIILLLILLNKEKIFKHNKNKTQ